MISASSWNIKQEGRKEGRKKMTRGGKKSSIAGILRFAELEDFVMMILGTLGAIGDGCSINCLLVFASSIMNNLGQGKSGRSNFMHQVEKSCLYFVYLGLAVLFLAFLEGYCWSRTSERLVLRIRYRYLEAVLMQEVGFFETQEATTSEIIASISGDTSAVQEVLSEKVPIFIMHSSTFISGMAFSVYFSWRLSLVALPFLSLLVIPGIIYGIYLRYLSRKSYEEYAKANIVVEQALSSIKTIYSFTAEKAIIDKYAAFLDTTLKLGIRQGIAKGLAVGCAGFSFAIWAFLAWYGSLLVIHHGESGGRIYAAGLSFVLGGMSLGMVLSELKHFTEASIVIERIIERIERVPLIDSEDQHGLIPTDTKGGIVFEHINFSYPSRPDTLILEDFNLVVPSGKTTALVGGSGSGKSTVIALVQRFYDVGRGMVKLDGVDIKMIKLKWMKARIGLVSQEHALFGISIGANIRIGKHDATMDEVVAAAKVANAHRFITQLPGGYETQVGEGGGFLSGGQKQRIAIARAVIKNPAILLLDEATSALDSESEVLVQNALQQASVGRTTLVVAHKLSTVRDAYQIGVVDGRAIVEVGSHDDLICMVDGNYSQLVKAQQKQFGRKEQKSELCSSSSKATGSGRRPGMDQSGLKASPSDDHIHDWEEEEEENNPPPPFFRVLAMSSSEWKQGSVGSFSAVVFGSLQPIYAFSIGGVIAAFFVPDHNEMQMIIHRYILVLCSLSLISIIVNLLQHYNFACMGEISARRIRLKMLEKIMTFECSWFDDQERNSSGALISRVITEASMVKTIVVDRVSLLIQTNSGVLIAMVMAISVAWKLAVVMISLQPLTIFCHYAKNIVLSRTSVRFVNAQSRSSQIAKEAVCNHRIITSFGCTAVILSLFEQAQENPRRAAGMKAFLVGITMGCAPCLSYLSWALGFWYGGKLTEAGEISAAAVFKTFFILVSTGKVIAEAGTMTSDLAKGVASIASIFSILDRKNPKQEEEEGGGHVGRKLKRLQGNVEISEVDFAYPTRPRSLVLRDFSLDVKAGSSVGLVGSSGCGKSTVLGLIQRFYDVDKGHVRIDGVDIRVLDMNWYRSFTSLVTQDPVIFSGTIHENIALGNPRAGIDEVSEAARAANAHDFISALKDGYSTDCGERGVQLSGGQKQRIAIARAVIRNPVILMLDEATSALDFRSERLVQESLDRIMTGRTTIVVAHRLNTVINLDSIAVVAEDGKVVERGAYLHLISNKQGHFYKLSGLP